VTPGTQIIEQSFWRILAPRWAHQALSGDGAAVHGSRFNRIGQTALYMSSDLETAQAEYQQDFPDRPGTFCRYDVSLDGVADLRDPVVCAKFNFAPAILACRWKYILLIEKQDPPTWSVVDRLCRAGVKGVLVPSQRHHGYNLVVYEWDETTVKPHDPNNDLPMEST